MKSHGTFKKSTLTSMVCFLVLSLLAGLNPSLAQTSNNPDASPFWSTLATNAWNYFQPGVGVDAATGLPQSSASCPYFTDWDTGLYLQAIIDAEKLELISTDGPWGSNDRIDRVLTFFETRPLMADGLPYFYYSSHTGLNSTCLEQVATDAGNLFVALKNLEVSKPNLKARVDNIVYNITNYERREVSVDVLLGQVQSGKREANIYDYYVICGFAGFWPERFSAEADAMLNLIVSRQPVNYNGVLLPSAKITSEPLLLSIFNFQHPDARLLNLTKQAYLAQEARYNMTGQLTAFSEGSSDTGLFLYEWIAKGDGSMWSIQTIEGNGAIKDVARVAPIAYLKAAAGFLAVYNTAYTQTMVKSILSALPVPVFGYNAGVDENGQVVSCSPDVGNSLIVSAARYAIDHNVSVPFPYPTSTASLPPVDTPSPSIGSLADSWVTAPTNTPEPKPTANPFIEQPTPYPSTVPKNEETTVHSQVPGQSWVYLVGACLVVGVVVGCVVFWRRRLAGFVK